MVDSTEKRLGDVAEIMAGLTGFSDKGKFLPEVEIMPVEEDI